MCLKRISSGTDDEDSDELGEADWDAIFANEEGEFMNNLNQGKIETFLNSVVVSPLVTRSSELSTRIF